MCYTTWVGQFHKILMHTDMAYTAYLKMKIYHVLSPQDSNELKQDHCRHY